VLLLPEQLDNRCESESGQSARKVAKDVMSEVRRKS